LVGQIFRQHFDLFFMKKSTELHSAIDSSSIQLPRRGRVDGFALLWMLAAVGLAGAAAAVIGPAVRDIMETLALRAEQDKLTVMAKQIEQSYTSSDPTINLSMSGNGNRAPLTANVNASDVALGGVNGFIASNAFTSATGTWTPGIGQTGDGLPFSVGTALGNVPAFSATSWECKFAKFISGDDLSSSGFSRAFNRESDDVGKNLFNSKGNKRLLVRGPTDEAGMQRWLLVSVMVPVHRGLRDFPLITFNQLWTLPGADTQTLPFDGTKAALSNIWNFNTYNRTDASRIVVQRIVQRKYTLNLTNSSSDRYMHVQITDGGTTFWVSGATDGFGNFVLSPGEAFPAAGITLRAGTQVIVLSGKLRLGLRGLTTWFPIATTTFAPTLGADVEEGPTEIARFRIQDSSTLFLNPSGTVGG
jgi:hypothetical protein